MEKNVILAFVLSVAVFALYFLLLAPKEPAQKAVQNTEKPIVEKKEAAAPSPGAKDKEIPQDQAGGLERAPQAARGIAVRTKWYEAVFSEQGGALKSLKLIAYREQLGGQDLKEMVLSERAGSYPLQLEWLKNSVADMNQALFKADKGPITLSSQRPQDTLTFRWVSGQGVIISKTYRFSYDSYRIDLDIVVSNKGKQNLDDNLALRLENRFVKTSDNASSFLGVLFSLNGDFKQINFDKVDKEEVFAGKVRWGALSNTYFMDAVVPLGEGTPVSMKLSKPSPEYLKAAFVHPPLTLAAGEEKKYQYAIFFGPRDTQILSTLGLGLEKAVNFGFFDIIAKPLLWVLRFFNGFLNNYGWAIIILTILVKILFWPLTHKSYKSMKEMQKLQPKMAKIREKYKDNREKMNQEMMALYKTYKVNPMGGCLPMVIQIPVFFALYSLLGYAIELRHAPFMLWINDLSAPDRLPIGVMIPYVGSGIPVLTLLMGASMFIQQKMTPTTGDPTQAKVMLFLPVIFTFMFINFASGLVLYWLVNNILSIGQQYYINRYVN
jgi:YidC/Oxa1 family membrane protein insertase